ncbi:hypothetical protein HOD75_02865 [archaeon]|jgi:hypothetical protein|nr:hypothetical protein [archaeon]MBT4241815.1 hypothetical protein [archaeon]MBT4418363.1 hypothetical protein [archaeon]
MKQRGITNRKLDANVYRLIDRMTHELDIDIPESEYAHAVLTDGRSEYDPNANLIKINQGDVYSGNVLGEEIGHFIRSRVKHPTSKKLGVVQTLKHYLGIEPPTFQIPETEEHTDEFFGYLGRKILKKIATPNDDLKFPKRKETRKQAVEELKKITQGLKDWEKYEKGEYEHPDITPEKIKHGQDQAKAVRRNILTHQRPYDFAEKTDLEQISDYKKLFELQDREVRMRFFRKNPLYELNKPLPKELKEKPKEPERKKPTLEKLVKIAIIPLVIGFLIILNYANTFLPKFTGFSIKNFNQTYSALILLIPLAIIILTFLYFKFRKKK